MTNFVWGYQNDEYWVIKMTNFWWVIKMTNFFMKMTNFFLSKWRISFIKMTNFILSKWRTSFLCFIKMTNFWRTHCNRWNKSFRIFVYSHESSSANRVPENIFQNQIDPKMFDAVPQTKKMTLDRMAKTGMIDQQLLKDFQVRGFLSKAYFVYVYVKPGWKCIEKLVNLMKGWKIMKHKSKR